MTGSVPICAGCKKLILTSYISALGQAWHLEHFVCAGCGLPIDQNSYYTQGQSAYHERCFQQRFLPQCAVCGEHIAGRYFVDAWGNSSCERHQSDHPICEYCGRLVTKAVTGGGLRCPDQRVICNICLQATVHSDEVAKPLIESVGAWLRAQGMKCGGIRLHVELMDVAKMAAQAPKHAPKTLLGVTIKEVATIQGRIVDRRVSGIGLLWALPSELFFGVAAHELGHAWLFVNRIDELPDWGEEGFCNLLSYLWYQHRNTPEADYQIQNLVANPDPVYGEGFRRVQALLRERSFASLLEYLERYHQLPAT